MKILISFVVLMMFSIMPIAQAGELSLTVKNITTEEGKLYIALWHTDHEKAWNQGELDLVKPAQQWMFSPKLQEITVSLGQIATGTYALRMYHDENGNEKLDTNLLGMPREGFGFSNDATGSFGPPPFAKAAFSIDGDTQQIITLQ